MNVALNNEQKLFVVSTGNSVSCVGFHVVYEQTREMGRRLKALSEKTLCAKGMQALLSLVKPSKDKIGTLDQYAQYRALLAGYTAVDDKKTWFDGRTPKKLQRVLEQVRKDGTRVRVFLGDSETGRDWLEDYDNIGRVGRHSEGAMKTPHLMLGDGIDGPSLLSFCIVRLIDVETGVELYRHAKYHTPKLVLAEAESYDVADGYSHCIKAEDVDGDVNVIMKFKSHGRAAHWLAYIQGESHDFVSCRYPD